jgi:hypothetical protein
VRLTRKVRVLRDVGEYLLSLRPHDLDIEVGLVVQVEAHSEQTPQIVQAASRHDHQTVSLNHLNRGAVIGHDPPQLVEDRLEGVFEAQRLAEHLRNGEERLGALPRALELGDVVVDRVEADVLPLDAERHEHHLHVDQLPVLPHATSDPVGTTSLERLVGDVPAFSAEVLVEDEVVDQSADRLLRRVAKELRRRRVPARHTPVGVHDDDGDRADLDERLQLVQPAARLRELRQEVDFRRHRSSSQQLVPTTPRTRGRQPLHRAPGHGRSIPRDERAVQAERANNGPIAVSRCCLGADYERFGDRNYLLRASLSLSDGHVIDDLGEPTRSSMRSRVVS